MSRPVALCLGGKLFDPAPVGASTRGELAPPSTPQLLAFLEIDPLER